MPDDRTHQTIAQRGDIDFHSRPDRMLRRRRGFLALAGLLSFGPLVYAILSGDESIYWSRPCSEAHRLIQQNCQHCHLERFQGALMQVEGPDYVRSIETRTCRVCHEDREAADHTPQMVETEITSCFECHREHRERPSLTRVDDAHCAGCHADLQTKDGDPSFVTALNSFAAHPEFALRRTSGDEAALPGPRHAATGLADRTAAGSSWRWSDRTRLHFNHRLHLQSEGIAAPGSGDGSPRTVTLGCGECHLLDADGRYMRPINYEQHCQNCHPLYYGEELFEFDTELHLGGPLPHAAPRIVRDAIRNRLMAWAGAHPERITGEAAPPPRLPHKQPANALGARDKWEWVDQRLAEVESVIYGKSSDVRFPWFMQGCTYCHFVEQDTSGGADGAGVPLEWTIAPPGIPDRWLPHSRFRHDRHDNLLLRGRRLECADCHYLTPPEQPPISASAVSGTVDGEAAHGVRRPGSIFESDATRDVLLPSIETCRECHGASDRRVFAGTARHDCVECHVYHHGAPAK